MEAGSSKVVRRVAGALSALTVAVSVAGLMSPGASAAVTWSDVGEAEAAVSAAHALVAGTEAELAALDDERRALETAMVRLEEREAEIAELAVEEGASIRDRIARMYMTAGAASARLAVADAGAFATRVAYLGAISERDRELVIQFSLTVADLESLRASAEQRLEAIAERSVEIEAALVGQVAALDEARSRLAAVRAEWERFEEAQRLAAEAELRRQEAEMSNQGTTTTAPAGGTTTTTAPSATTTTLPTWSPSAGVEQWRGLVTEVFGRWGLDRTSCETRNGIEFCVGPQIDNALRIMQCESSGNPMARNPSSGTSGLFQNHPAYWQGRVDRVRAQHPAKAPTMPADASIFNPEYNITVAALLVWESKEVLLGRRGGGGIGSARWPEFNFDIYYNGNPLAFGYSVWGKGPNPWGHWVGCAASRTVNALGDSGVPYTYASGQGIYDSGWIHPWATRREP
jgi:peptidoglycan hydrolase CwlO-like protein